MSKSNLNATAADDRRSRRTDVRFSAVVEAGPGRKYTVLARNVSAHGVMIELDAHFVPGRPVTFEMAGLGRVAGRVAWTRDGHAGIAFATPLTLEQISEIL